MITTHTLSGKLFRTMSIGFLLIFGASQTSQACDAHKSSATIEETLTGDYRDSAKHRDQFRNPAQTLAFFEVTPDTSVVEIWPGGGWYAEILAPYLADTGQYYAAHFDPESSVEFFRRSRAQFESRIEQEPQLFSKVNLTSFAPPTIVDIAPVGSVDRVLTFRNVHNWYMRGAGESTLTSAFQAFYDALKPGGILGIVEHRLPEDRPLKDQNQTGYMKQSYVVGLAEQVGFTLEAASEINANPEDTADHPNGVWTLPPRLRTEDADKATYEAIGESDRMTLKFRKPN